MVRVAVAVDHRSVAIRRPPVDDTYAALTSDLPEHSLRYIHAVVAHDHIRLKTFDRSRGHGRGHERRRRIPACGGRHQVGVFVREIGLAKESHRGCSHLLTESQFVMMEEKTVVDRHG